MNYRYFVEKQIRNIQTPLSWYTFPPPHIIIRSTLLSYKKLQHLKIRKEFRELKSLTKRCQ